MTHRVTDRMMAVLAPDRTELWKGTDIESALMAASLAPGAQLLTTGAWGWEERSAHTVVAVPADRRPRVLLLRGAEHTRHGDLSGARHEAEAHGGPLAWKPSTDPDTGATTWAAADWSITEAQPR
ncbi:hypothetical protein [Kitasatospora viridis]|uniref:Uncharacterized protein n=1 Tax=Kitasatospora viridis TaxID=281105 RepID=A0A561SA10_9ACTN|nr:hypothetical protein [Kitasatospora viridis]TWF71710.1 hypothetical protein FHX73_1881 [Kitasatospora viridis]